jgi:hypothetical protein
MTAFMVPPPYGVSLRQHLSEHPPHEDVSAFELGLDFILDGLEKIRDTAGA